MQQADEWTPTSPEGGQVDWKQLHSMTTAIREQPDWKIHAVLIERDHQLLYEQYFAGKDERWGQPLGQVTFNAETMHDLRSVTKSVVSALVGTAFTSGAIPSLDAPIIHYFPEYAELCTPEWQHIMLWHALTMTAGLEWNEDVPYNDPHNDEIGLIQSSEPLRYVLSRPIVTEPGSIWRYNGGLTQLLAAIVQRATATPLLTYAEATLFRPLGITEYEWLGDIGGMPAAASGLRLRPRDLAKFASLYLHQGRWKDQQIVSADWVEQSTQVQVWVANRSMGGYGYHWWNGSFATLVGQVARAAVAVGNGEQRLFILPELNSAVTILAGRYNDFSSSPSDDLLQAYILPALVGEPQGETAV